MRIDAVSALLVRLYFWIKRFVMGNSKSTFIIVMRGPAAVIFWQEENLRIEKLPSKFGPLTVSYATRWIKRSEKVVVPGQLWIEISGEGDNLENVMEIYANAALAAIPILALSANAAIGEAQIEVGFESTSGKPEREYFQSYIPPETGTVHIGRHIDVNLAVSVMDSISRNPEAERLLRAANQYRLALDSWKLGNESLSLAHLWMALEALTKVALRAECIKNKCTEAELVTSLGIERKQLDATIRKTLILKGDEECYRKAKDASDGLEHGYLNFSTIREYARDVRHRMASHIRRAILELSDIPSNDLSKLLSDPFDKPIGHWPIAKYLRGLLIGESEKLAKDGNAYPIMRWNPTVNGCETNEVGKLTYQFTDSISPELADGVSFSLQSIEAWRPD